MLAERPTEADVRDELEHRMRRLGADGPSYDTIVASGPDNAARPHHQTGRRTIVEGDTVIIDVGALVDGYHSDMTRTFVVGDPSPEQRGRLRPRARGPARRARRGRRRRRRPDVDADVPRTCSPTPATATGTSTAPATASASTSTRTRSRRQVSTDRAGGRGRGDRRTRPLSWRLRRGPHRGPRHGHRRRAAAASPTCPRTPHACHHHQRPEDRDHAAARQRAVPGRRVPARQAGQGRRLRAHQAAQRHAPATSSSARSTPAIRVEQAIVDRQDMQFLYRDGDDYVFMNTSTYDQMHGAAGGARRRRRLPRRAGRRPDRPVPGRDHRRRDPGVGRAERSPQTEPGVQGDRVSGARKPAVLETGKTVQVPLFVESATASRSTPARGDYITRV